MKKNVYIIIPVYNEESVIWKILLELKKNRYKNIIVVDDGSTDNTFGEAFKGKVLVIRHCINRGKGAALKTGIEAAKKLNADVIVTFDGDGQHDPKDIRKLTAKISDGYDVVLGSRFLRNQTIPLYKRLANAIANIMTYIICGIWVTDSQSGLRAYTIKALEVINTKNDRYEVESEMLWQIRIHKLSYIEVPMNVRYTKYSQTKQNKQTIWSGVMTVFRLLRSGSYVV